jgi:hypothetical protein
VLSYDGALFLFLGGGLKYINGPSGKSMSKYVSLTCLIKFLTGQPNLCNQMNMINDSVVDIVDLYLNLFSPISAAICL